MAAPIPTAAAGRRARLAAPGRMERYQTRVGSALTPQVVSSILRAADLGEMERQADLLDEVLEKDGHLQAVLSKRAGFISGSAWELTAAPGTPKRRGEKLVAACRDLLTNVVGFPAFLEDLLSGTYQGRAVCEAIWVRDGRYQRQECFESVHARRLRYAPDDWALRISDVDRESPFSRGFGLACAEVNRLVPGKLVVHLPRVRGGYPTREGLGRTAVWYAGVFKAFTWRDLLAYLEQYGRPMRFGTFGTGKGDLPLASDEDVDELLESLDGLSCAMAAAFPDTTKPTLLPPATASLGSSHPEVIRLCDAEVSKLVLGGTLTTDAGTKGARSLGDTHREEEIVLARRDAASVAETVRRFVLMPFVEINGLGSAREAPLLRFAVDPPEDLNGLATRFKTLAEAKVRVPAKHVRARLAVPEPEGDEECIGGAPEPAEEPRPAPQGPGAKTPSGEPDGADTEPGTEE